MIILSALSIVITVFQLLTCLFLTLVVLLQSGKRSGLSGAISGAADTFLVKNKAKTLDAKLAKATKWIAGAFVIFTLVLNIIL
jgi:preprotein translocase subunit SecG